MSKEQTDRCPPMSNPSAQELAGLLDRVGNATGPDRRIDRDLSVLPGGPNWRRVREDTVAYFRHEDTVDGRTMAFASGPVDCQFDGLNESAWPPYTASIDAALALVEKVLPDWQMEQISWGKDKGGPIIASIGNFGRADEYRCGYGDATTIPLAILAALLDALSSLKAST